jgi:hypothetical protein
VKLLNLMFIFVLSISFAHATGGDVSGGGDSVELEVERTLTDMSDFLIENQTELNDRFDIDAFTIAVIAKNTTVINVKKQDLANIEYGESFFQMKRKGHKRTVYAKNYRLPEKVIFINNELWSTLKDEAEKEYIIFHELLGVSNIEVDAYKKGNKIYKDILDIKKQNKKLLKRITKKIGNLFAGSTDELSDRYYKTKEEAVLHRIQFDAAIYLKEQRIAELEQQQQQLDQQIARLEAKSEAIEICIDKLNVQDLANYGAYQFGDRYPGAIEANNKVEKCVEELI